MAKIPILFLYTELTPSVVAVFRCLTEGYNVNVHVVFWERGGQTPYRQPEILNVNFYPAKTWSPEQILGLVSAICPVITYISAWEDKRYLLSARKLVKELRLVVAGFDDVWSGSIRQRCGSVLVSLLGKHYFTHAMVSGPRQYEYAKRFGFRDRQILYYVFGCDIQKFSAVARDGLRFTDSDQEDRMRSFLYVGRFVKAKAIDVLAQAFLIYKREFLGTWRLTCVGNGPLKEKLNGIEDLIVIDYLSHDELCNLLRSMGAFILPSRFDVSPLVVQEFASAGLPIVLSDAVGNRLLFLINGWNGFLFENENPRDLARQMFKISSLPEGDRYEMGIRSARLAAQHDPQYVAASLMSILPEQKDPQIGN